MENWEVKETPRQRIVRLRKQVAYWKCHGDSRYCEPDICFFCVHFRHFFYDEGGSDCDCHVHAPRWLRGDSPIEHCRQFKAVKDWRFQCERHLNLLLADVVKDLTGRLTEAKSPTHEVLDSVTCLQCGGKWLSEYNFCPDCGE